LKTALLFFLAKRVDLYHIKTSTRLGAKLVLLLLFVFKIRVLNNILDIDYIKPIYQAY